MTSPKAPTGLASRGRRLWADAWKSKPAMGPGDRVLLEEACRLADRLDKLNGLVAGKSSVWAEIDWPYEEAPATLVISSAMTEARQGAAELRQLVKALDLPVATEVPVGESKLKVLLGGAS